MQFFLGSSSAIWRWVCIYTCYNEFSFWKRLEVIFCFTISKNVQSYCLYLNFNQQVSWQKPVLDRIGLIIEIFNAHAETKEAKLQVLFSYCSPWFLFNLQLMFWNSIFPLYSMACICFSCKKGSILYCGHDFCHYTCLFFGWMFMSLKDDLQICYSHGHSQS